MFRRVFTVKNKTIGNGRTFIIAEIGSNHNQKINIAKKLIDKACNSGADAVKFQSIRFEELYTLNNKNRRLKRLFEKIHFKEEWAKELSDYCMKKGIIFFSAPTYLKAVETLVKLNVGIYKIASPQTIAFPQLIKKIASLNRPMVMSTGYCTISDIDRAVKIVETCRNKRLALLHCVSAYPTNPENANLKLIRLLKNRYKLPVGFSDHSLGYELALAAVALGADIIEKHITLSRKQNGPDHHFALEIGEFEKMVKGIRKVERSIGSGKNKKISKDETKNFNKINMAPIANNKIEKNLLINIEKDIVFRRNAKGINAWQLFESGPLFAAKTINKGQAITYKAIKAKKEKEL